MILSLFTAFATPMIDAAPPADRPPMIAGDPVCHASIAHDATGKVTGVEVDKCRELFAASTRMAAEQVKLSGVETAGVINLRYFFSADGVGHPRVAPTSMPVLGLPYDLKILSSMPPKFPKKMEFTEPVRCMLDMKVDAAGLATDVTITMCPESFHEEIFKVLKRWRWETVANPPEGGAPTLTAVIFQKGR